MFFISTPDTKTLHQMRVWFVVLTVSAPGCWCRVGPGPLIAHSERGSVSVGFQVTFCITSREVASAEIYIFTEAKEVKYYCYIYKSLFYEEK